MRTLEARTEAILWVLALLAGAGWWQLSSAWTVDWVTAPHHRGVVAACKEFYERPPEWDLRSCSSTTDDGRRYVHGAGQGDVGDEFTYVDVEHGRQGWGSGAAFAPGLLDWAQAVGAIGLMIAALRGMAILARIEIRRHRRSAAMA